MPTGSTIELPCNRLTTKKSPHRQGRGLFHFKYSFLFDEKYLEEQLLAREGLTNVLSSTQPLRTLDLFNSFEPDLVILDLHMPEFDGFAILEQLSRRIPTGEYLPILVLTADATRDTRLRALSLGARDFISKPLDALETMLRVWNLLETRVLYKTLRTLVPAGQIDLLQRCGSTAIA